MDIQAFSYVNELMRIINGRGDTRLIIETFLAVLRREYVFDNVAAYLQDEKTGMLEIVYARAVGRAKNAEADDAWGEDIANQVLAKKQFLIQEPESVSETEDRVHQAYLMGIPLHADSVLPRLITVFHRHREKGTAREVMLEELAQMEGIYVPAFYEVRYHPSGTVESFVPKGNAPARVMRAAPASLDRHPAHSAIITPFTEFSSMFLMEVSRGLPIRV